MWLSFFKANCWSNHWSLCADLWARSSLLVVVLSVRLLVRNVNSSPWNMEIKLPSIVINYLDFWCNTGWPNCVLTKRKMMLDQRIFGNQTLHFVRLLLHTFSVNTHAKFTIRWHYLCWLCWFHYSLTAILGT